MKDEIKEILEQSLDYEFDLTFNQRKQILDYITNLQEKTNRLEDRLINRRMRIDKAIEYINEHIKYECDGTYSGMSFYSHHLYDNFKKQDLLNILQGDDKDVEDKR